MVDYLAYFVYKILYFKIFVQSSYTSKNICVVISNTCRFIKFIRYLYDTCQKCQTSIREVRQVSSLKLFFSLLRHYLNWGAILVKYLCTLCLTIQTNVEIFVLFFYLLYLPHILFRQISRIFKSIKHIYIDVLLS